MVRHYYAIYINGYLSRLGVGYDAPEITEQEYNSLLDLIRNKPSAPDNTHEYWITEAGEYELVEVEPLPEPEPTSEDYEAAWRILMGEGENG